MFALYKDYVDVGVLQELFVRSCLKEVHSRKCKKCMDPVSVSVIFIFTLKKRPTRTNSTLYYTILSN